jgi:hypothetical protein
MAKEAANHINRRLLKTSTMRKVKAMKLEKPSHQRRTSSKKLLTELKLN